MRPLPLVCAVLLLLPLPLRATDDSIATILCYHEVDDAPVHQPIPRRDAKENTAAEQYRYTISRDVLIQHLDYLDANGYTIIPLELLVSYVNGTVASLPPRSVVITVDDGWACAYTDILPALAARGVPFTLFVYPAFVGQGSHSVSWDQLRLMARLPNVEIGSHSLSHPFLTRKNNPRAAGSGYDSFLAHELDESRKRIEAEIGKPVRYLAYPFGDYDAQVRDAAEGQCYEAAVTVTRGTNTRKTPRMELRRYLIHNTTTLEEFRTFLPSR